MSLAPSPAAIRPAPKPSFEGDFALPREFPLEAGGVLHAATLRYAIYGEISPARDNVVLVCHALSGSAQVGEWWPSIFAPGSFIDAQNQAVLCINFLGSCYGSTGPTSIDPATGKRYGKHFPLVTIADNVRAEALLLDALNIPRVQLALGASIGGMQVLEWAIRFPARIARAIAIGVAPLSAMGLGLNHLQRQAIMLDPDWRDGDYPPDAPPRRGLALARALAVCSYKSPELFEERFARKPDRSGEDPWQDPLQDTGQNSMGDPPWQPQALTPGRFDIAGYLDHQGEKFNSRFDANSYLAITRMMDLFDPTRGHPSPFEVWGRIQADVTLIGISSDWLFPPTDVAAMAAAIIAAGVRCRYREILSGHGHDAFLAEPQALLDLLKS
jgi:homoserine O-acetyltransferase